MTFCFITDLNHTMGFDGVHLVFCFIYVFFLLETGEP
jgi:hypothetical protein